MKRYFDCSYIEVLPFSITLLATMILLLILIFTQYNRKKNSLLIAVDGILIHADIGLLCIIIQCQTNIWNGNYSGSWFFSINAHKFIMSFNPPVFIMYLLCAVLLIYICIRFIYIRFINKPEITASSVKESFDNLPNGICFADEKGIICMCNRQMSRLCQDLIHTDLQHILELHRAFVNPPSTVEIIDPVAHSYRFPSGTIWKFFETDVRVGSGKEYTQVQAIDITELYEKCKELENKNTELQNTNARAKKLYYELDRIVNEEETLATKMHIHDEIGLRILSSVNCLSQNPSLQDIKKNSEMWKLTLAWFEIRDDNFEHISEQHKEETNNSDSLKELISIAHEIGLKISVTGELPKNQNALNLVHAAIRECTTNTVRHAHGTRLNVDISRVNGFVKVFITDNGTVKNNVIIEGGGLLGLRQRIERIGGIMIVQGFPKFTLSVFIPDERSCQND